MLLANEPLDKHEISHPSICKVFEKFTERNKPQKQLINIREGIPSRFLNNCHQWSFFKGHGKVQPISDLLLCSSYVLGKELIPYSSNEVTALLKQRTPSAVFTHLHVPKYSGLPRFLHYYMDTVRKKQKQIMNIQ